MKHLITILLAVTATIAAQAQSGTLRQQVITTSQFSREANTNETAAGWRAKLGVSTGGAGTNGGTVTSVGLTVPAPFTVSGGPVTGAGTITLGLPSQSASRFLGGPDPADASIGAPSFRALVALDIPNLPASIITSGQFSTAVQGAGPADGSTFLRGDGFWATPPTTTTVSIPATPVQNGTLSSNDFSRVQVSAIGERIEDVPWNGAITWYWLGQNTSEAIIKGQIDIIYNNGLTDYGWKFVEIDDGWQYTNRVNGRLTWNTILFPSGIPALVQYAHDRGVKLGIYTDDGPLHSNTGLASTPTDMTEVDAADMASWGVDYIKYDVFNQGIDCAKRLNTARRFLAALRRATPRPIVLMSGGFAGEGTANLTNFNVTDISGALQEFRPVVDFGVDGLGPLRNWTNFIGAAYVGTAERFSHVVRPGHFINLDHFGPTPAANALGDGFPADSYTNLDRGQSTMLAMLNCPLNVSKFTDNAEDPYRFAYFTNRALLSLNQDPLVLPATRVISNATGSVWVKKLNNGSRAVAWMNAQTNATFSQSINLTKLGFDTSQLCLIYDVWNYTNGTTSGTFTGVAPKQSCALFIFTPTNLPAAAVTSTYPGPATNQLSFFGIPYDGTGTPSLGPEDSNGVDTIYQSDGTKRLRVWIPSPIWATNIIVKVRYLRSASDNNVIDYYTCYSGVSGLTLGSATTLYTAADTSTHDLTFSVALPAVAYPRFVVLRANAGGSASGVQLFSQGLSVVYQ